MKAAELEALIRHDWSLINNNAYARGDEGSRLNKDLAEHLNLIADDTGENGWTIGIQAADGSTELMRLEHCLEYGHPEGLISISPLTGTSALFLATHKCPRTDTPNPSNEFASTLIKEAMKHHPEWTSSKAFAEALYTSFPKEKYEGDSEEELAEFTASVFNRPDFSFFRFDSILDHLKHRNIECLARLCASNVFLFKELFSQRKEEVRTYLSALEKLSLEEFRTSHFAQYEADPALFKLYLEARKQRLVKALEGFLHHTGGYYRFTNHPSQETIKREFFLEFLDPLKLSQFQEKYFDPSHLAVESQTHFGTVSSELPKIQTLLQRCASPKYTPEHLPPKKSSAHSGGLAALFYQFMSRWSGSASSAAAINEAEEAGPAG